MSSDYMKTIFDDSDYDMDGCDIDLFVDLLGEWFSPEELGIGPRLKELDWTEEFKRDMITGNGFIIKQKATDKFKNILPEGIHSPKFGTTWSDENAFQERYRCECGELIGKLYEGEVCPKCHTKVKFNDVNLDIFGWMCLLHDYYIIQPAMYKKIYAFIGKKNLPNILDFKYVMNKDGYFEKPVEQDKQHPFYGIGMYEFRKRFDEIMLWYYNKKKQKKDLYENIMQNKQKVFSKYIPVYSAILRQLFVTDEDYSFIKIDRKYNALFGNISKLNKDPMNVLNVEKVNKTLYKAQQKINCIYDLIFATINQKEGWIREGVLGGRINFSARNVIIPDDTLRAYQIRLPYLTFLELYQQEIVNLIVKLHGCSFTTAINYWFAAQTSFSPMVYEVMNYLVRNTKHKVRCLIYRDPINKMGTYSVTSIVNLL